jgi:hypothetical protein
MNFLSLFTRKASILGLGAALAGWGIVFFAALDGFGQPALAFARNDDLPCSACHGAWPKPNNFRQVVPVPASAAAHPQRRRSRRMVLIFQAWITGF